MKKSYCSSLDISADVHCRSGTSFRQTTGRLDAVRSLRSRVDPENRVLAGQDFRHATQEMGESVAEYIRRLERLFQAAYGHDGLSVETRQTLLYSQLQEGLKYGLIKSPAVSGAD